MEDLPITRQVHSVSKRTHWGEDTKALKLFDS
jgi:hypothetical protein